MRRLLIFGLALTTAGCGGAKSTDDWLRQLKDSDVVKRREAVREPGGRGGEAGGVVPALANALRDESHYVRHDAATALGKLGPAAAPAVPALTAALKDKEKSVRTAAGVALTVNAGNTTSVPVGTLYRDNMVAAWGRVSANGTLADGFNVATVTRNSAGNYTVKLNTSFTGTALVPVASVSYIGAQPASAAAIRFASTNQLLSNNTFNVFINNGTFAAADADFTFIVTGR